MIELTTIPYLDIVFIVLVLIVAIMIITVLIMQPAEKNYSIKKRNMKATISVNNVLLRIPILNTTYKNTLELFLLETEQEKEKSAYIKAQLIALGSIVMAVLLIVFCTFFSRVWYTILLDIFVSLFTGAMLSSSIEKAVRVRINSKMPDAINELQSAYINTKNVIAALEQSYPLMDKSISRLFQTFYKNLLKSPDEALLKIRLLLNDNYMNRLLELLKISLKQGVDISGGLIKLSLDIIEETGAKTEQRKTLLKYKAMAIVALASDIVGVYFNVKINKDLMSYYNNTVKGSNILAVSILACMAYYVFVEIMDSI